MSPGDISKVSLSDAVAFRVDFDDAVPSSSDLYWRGPVLGRQRGKTWLPYQVQTRLKADYEPQSAPISYRITLQPSNKPWMSPIDRLPSA